MEFLQIYKTNRFKNFIRKFLKQLSREKTVSTTINIDNNDSNTVTGYPCKESTRIESRTATLKREKHKEQMDNGRRFNLNVILNIPFNYPCL